MQSMQDRVLGAIEVVIETNGFEAVRRGDFANTGHVYAMKGLSAPVDIAYDFQSGYCSITITSDALADIKDNPPTFRFGVDSLRGCMKANTVAFLMLKYTQGERMDLMIEMVGRACGR